ERALAVDGDLLARLVALSAPEVPRQRVGEGRRVAEAVAERLPEGLALGLELLADLAILVPRLGELLHADLGEPRAPVGDRVADDGVGHGQPATVDLGGGVEDLVEAALGLAD